jgi:hypothetical protein
VASSDGAAAMRRLSPLAVSRLGALARHSVIPITRLGPRRAVVVAGILTLGACGSADPELPPPPCPAALFLDGAERTSAYRAGTESRPEDLRYIAVLTDLSSSCRYYEAADRQGVDVDVSFKVIAERGPALLDKEEVTYFVATVGPDGRILTRDALGGDLPFVADEQHVALSEDLTLHLSFVTPAQASYYRLFIGFQLDDAELQRREQPLLR